MNETLEQYMTRLGFTPEQQTELLKLCYALGWSVSQVATALNALVISSIDYIVFDVSSPKAQARLRSKQDLERKRRPGKYRWGGK
jgi:hypothetical protein